MIDLLNIEPSIPKKEDTNRITSRILIVDDDPVTRCVLDGMLRNAGYETICVENLASAENALASNSVSLILLDNHLPDGKGLDLCRKLSLRPTTAQTPILFISANMDIETKIQGFAAGGVDYITKPFATAEVLARVRTQLRLQSAYKSLARLHLEHVERLAASQQSMMPSPASLLDANFQVCMRQVCYAGGDFYDVLQTGNHINDYIVADASGHDLSQSLWTASFKTVLSEYASILYSPEEICNKINLSLERILPHDAYFSSIYARIDRINHKLTLVNCGHPSAILVSRALQQSRIMYQEGDLLGIFPDTVFGKQEIPIYPEDRLYLYSDGLVEIDGSRQRGMERLREVCLFVNNLIMKDAVDAIVNTMCAGRNPEDDIILMGICI